MFGQNFHITITIHPSLSSFTLEYIEKKNVAKTINSSWDNIEPMKNINVNINNIYNYKLQAQQLPFHQLNTNLINCNIPQNRINTTHEDTFLESMKNSLDH